MKEVWLSLPLLQATHKEEGANHHVSTVNSTVNFLKGFSDSHGITDIQLSLLQKMTEDPNITIAKLSTVTGLDRNAVNYQLKKLRKIINIERSGSDKKRKLGNIIQMSSR